jgi:TrmH family RNA methyltransferase
VELERISQLKTPHQVLAVVRKFDSSKKVELTGRVTLVLDTIQDPGNLGTIVRTADWFGVSQIICSEDCADVYNPKVVQATMGSIARVNIYYVDVISWLKENKSVRVYATLLEGKDVTRMSPINEGIIVFGNESRGMKNELIGMANEKITIPGKGRAESLNASVAVGIVLSHLT